MLTVRLAGLAFGHRVGLEVPADLAAEAWSRLPPTWSAVDGPVERTWRLTLEDDAWLAQRDGMVFAGGPDPVEVLDLLIGDLELWLAEHAEGLVFVHAGAVTWNGLALLLPGRSRAGKSTLVAALVQAGAGYLSDEYAVIDPTGLIHPYPRPLSLRAPDGGPPARTPVQQLGGSVAQPVRLGLVAHLSYEAGAGWAVEALSPAATVLALIDNTVPARTRPVAVMDHLQAAVRGARGLSGRRGDTLAAVPVLLKEMSLPFPLYRMNTDIPPRQ